ncbi:MAG TPA: TetR/AcrR family transcriptional regulator [Streptosporangiaceae bacterium]
MVTTSGPTRRAGRPPETATDQAQPPRHPPATTDQARRPGPPPETSGPTRRPGRPPKVEAGDTKAALLAAALTLFARHGYAGTSIRAIAREVGLSESVLYAHFDSKRAIFEAVLAQLGPRSAATVLGEIGPGVLDADPPGVVRMLVTRVIQSWDTPEARQLISLMSHDGLTHDAALVGAIEETLGRLAALFERWIAAGHIDADLGEPADLAYALIGPVAQARLLWLHADATPTQRQTGRDISARHAEFFIKAVFRPTG